MFQACPLFFSSNSKLIKKDVPFSGNVFGYSSVLGFRQRSCFALQDTYSFLPVLQRKI